jgi:hypothetical protein
LRPAALAALCTHMLLRCQQAPCCCQEVVRASGSQRAELIRELVQQLAQEGMAAGPLGVTQGQAQQRKAVVGAVILRDEQQHS